MYCFIFNTRNGGNVQDKENVTFCIYKSVDHSIKV